MSQQIYNLYKKSMLMLEEYEAAKAEEEPPEEIAKIAETLRGTLEAIELAWPNISEKISRDTHMQKSFTHQQIDFICYQIGDWYLEWQDKMWIDGKPNQHWLGTAKEQLKTMICGD
jgi:hypothetical protein